MKRLLFSRGTQPRTFVLDMRAPFCPCRHALAGPIPVKNPAVTQIATLVGAS
jgi:hypothetical protein